MTDLTEQWKKGELSLDKSYYLRLQDGSEEIQMYVGGFLCNENNEVKEVLAPVPSYEEWQAKLEENTKLKELLKQAKGSVWLERECDNSLGNTVWNETTKLLNEINEVLGEE